MRVFLTFSFLLLQLCLEKLIQERHFLLPRGQLFTTQNYNRKRLSEFKPNLLHPGIMFTTVISFFPPRMYFRAEEIVLRKLHNHYKTRGVNYPTQTLRSLSVTLQEFL